MKARLFTDGGARGNPGPAASAFVLEADDGTVLAAEGDVPVRPKPRGERGYPFDTGLRLRSFPAQDEGLE